MISKTYLNLPNRVYKTHILQYKQYSTVIDVKVDPTSSESSYVNNLQQEWSQAKPFKSVPGPTKFQMFRSFMKGGEFNGLPLNDVLTICRQRYGNVYYLPGLFGQNSNFVTFNLDDYEKIFRTEGPYPIRPGGEVLTYYRLSRKDNLYGEDYLGVAGNGKQWGKFRHAVNPVLMQPRNAKLYMEPMQKVNNEFIKRILEIRDAETQEVPGTFLEDLNHLAFESIAVVALDKEMGVIRNTAASPEAQALFANFQAFTKAFYDLGFKPSIYKYIKTPTYRRFETAMDKLSDITLKFTNEAIERIENKRSPNKGNSVLEQLIKIDRKIATIMAVDMLIGGVEATSTALTAVILCIATNPDKQQKLRQEVLSTIGKNEKFTLENTKNLPYLRACIKEALRLYPVNFGNFRATGMDLRLGGYQIPKGTNVFLTSNLLAQEERYFPKSKDFIPERWLRSEEHENDLLSIKNINPFIYLPFGFGPRSCVGKRIVDLEIEITISNLVRNFQIEYNYPTENVFKNYFMNIPVAPLKFKFTDL